MLDWKRCERITERLVEEVSIYVKMPLKVNSKKKKKDAAESYYSFFI